MTTKNKNGITVPKALEIALEVFPNQRAGQIMFNALDTKGMARLPNGVPRDIFYVQDEDLIEALLDYAKLGRKRA